MRWCMRTVFGLASERGPPHVACFVVAPFSALLARWCDYLYVMFICDFAVEHYHGTMWLACAAQFNGAFLDCLGAALSCCVGVAIFHSWRLVPVSFVPVRCMPSCVLMFCVMFVLDFRGLVAVLCLF